MRSACQTFVQSRNLQLPTLKACYSFFILGGGLLDLLELWLLLRLIGLRLRLSLAFPFPFPFVFRGGLLDRLEL